MKDYTINEKREMGEKLAEIFELKRDPHNKEYYSTSIGSKSVIGVFEIVRRLGNIIEEGDSSFMKW